MNAPFDDKRTDDILPAEEAETVDAWSLGELEQLSDLDSVRAAWTRSDDPAG